MSKQYWIKIEVRSDHGKLIFSHKTWFWDGLLGTWFDVMDCFKDWIPKVIGEYESRKDIAKADKAESRLVTCQDEN